MWVTQGAAPGASAPLSPCCGAQPAPGTACPGPVPSPDPLPKPSILQRYFQGDAGKDLLRPAECIFNLRIPLMLDRDELTEGRLCSHFWRKGNFIVLPTGGGTDTNI